MKLSALAVALLTFLLALLTSLPGVGYIDSGEMVAAAATLGVPHPTGYPLLMIVGKAWTALWPGDPVDGLNVLNALFLAAASGMLVPLFDRFLHPDGRTPGFPFAATGAALLLSVTTIWWSVGTGFEAYALAALLMVLVLYTFLIVIDSLPSDHSKIENRKSEFRPPGGIDIAAFAFVLGLAFANHMMTTILAPACLGLYLMRAGLGRDSLVRLGKMIPFFLLGLLPYLYLPLRAAAEPVLNWGRPDTFGRFIEHVTGGQYQGAMFDFSVLESQLGWFFSTLPSDLLWIGLLLPILGIVDLARRHRYRLIFALLILIYGLFFAGTYAIREIEPYFLPVMIALGLLSAAGLSFLARHSRPQFALAGAAILAVAAIILHFDEVDRSSDTLPATFASDLLEGLPDNALLLTTRWDWMISPTLYAQHVEGVRPDVTIANVNMLHDRVYLSQLVDRIPRLGNAKDQIAYFRRVRFAYDAGQSGFDEEIYGIAFAQMVNGLIAAHGGPVLVTPEVDGTIGLGMNRIPVNLALLLRRDTSTYIPQKNVFASPIAPAAGPDIVDRSSVALYYAEMAKLRALYEVRRGRDTAARIYRSVLFDYRPTYTVDDIPQLPLDNENYLRQIVMWFANEEKIKR